MKDNFLQPKSICSLNPKLILLDENKLKNLENRLMGPNNEGKAPSECQPLKESELENIKTKMLLNGPLAPKEIKENINIINEINKNKNKNSEIKGSINNEIKTEEKLLQKKRFSEDKNNKKIIEDQYLKDDLLNLERNNSNNSNKSNLSEITYKSNNNSNSELSPKNNIVNTSNKYNKSITDYYPTTFISRSNNNSNQIRNTNNKTNISTHKKYSGEKYSSNNLIDINENSIKDKSNYEYSISVEQLMKKINEKNLIIEAKDKEISNLILTQKENEVIIKDLQEYKNN